MIKTKNLTSWQATSLYIPRFINLAIPLTTFNGVATIPVAGWKGLANEQGLKVIDLNMKSYLPWGVVGGYLLVPSHWNKGRINRTLRGVKK